MRFHFFLILIALLSACTTTTTSNKKASTTTNTNTLPSSLPKTSNQDFSQIAGSNFRGKLIYKGKTAYFESCDDSQQLPVSNNAVLREIYNTINDDNSTPVYTEFLGELTFPQKSSSKQQVIVRVDQVLHMAVAKTSLQCAKSFDTFSFKAKGEGPYWRINMHEDNLFLATKENNQSFTLNNSKIETTLVRLLNGSNQQGQKLSLTIKPGDCYLADNKEYWGVITEVNSTLGKFNGCGESGHLNNSPSFVGDYLSESVQLGKKQIVNLTLNSNHTVQYKLEDSSKRVTKTGFWKSNSPDTVVLMLSKQGDTSIQQEIVFKRKELSLFSNQINDNHVVSNFDNQLLFDKIQSQQTLGTEAIQTKRQFTAQLIPADPKIDLAVKNAVQHYFKIHRTDPKDTRFSSVRFDLNGDGKNEAIALLDWCSANGCEMLVFEEQEQGLVFSSRVSRVQAPILVAQKQNFSWQSLFVEKDQQWLQLDFDGLSYPLQISKAISVKPPLNSTGIVLFNEGNPTTWFPIK